MADASNGRSDDLRRTSMVTLHEQHSAELLRFALRLTHDHQTAEDIVQESLLRAWKDPAMTDRSNASNRARLFTVVRHLVVDRWRSAASRHEAPDAELPERAGTDGYAEVLDNLLIIDALASLSVEHRQVVCAAYYEGRSVHDIALELQVPPGTVKSRLHYGLRSLRLALQAKGVSQP